MAASKKFSFSTAVYDSSTVEKSAVTWAPDLQPHSLLIGVSYHAGGTQRISGPYSNIICLRNATNLVEIPYQLFLNILRRRIHFVTLLPAGQTTMKKRSFRSDSSFPLKRKFCSECFRYIIVEASAERERSIGHLHQ